MHNHTYAAPFSSPPSTDRDGLLCGYRFRRILLGDAAGIVKHRLLRPGCDPLVANDSPACCANCYENCVNTLNLRHALRCLLPHAYVGIEFFRPALPSVSKPISHALPLQIPESRMADKPNFTFLHSCTMRVPITRVSSLSLLELLVCAFSTPQVTRCKTYLNHRPNCIRGCASPILITSLLHSCTISDSQRRSPPNHITAWLADKPVLLAFPSSPGHLHCCRFIRRARAREARGRASLAAVCGESKYRAETCPDWFGLRRARMGVSVLCRTGAGFWLRRRWRRRWWAARRALPYRLESVAARES
ncbi:uncharacterized protein B0H18DRAFT_521333 [Fomitopsis serialis]|uniref:uncharacterized protein n=1 Tax=Fomitopsis serialis TaxID=139415 RepID=UPI00200826DF|nr:uncharacterized protein B0H18DRAFT_521333 [Neoantrodia serialis]KAH9922165.1 hypothetical protein B0H18DRAFT_521333 [Neoantrodia serialis]